MSPDHGPERVGDSPEAHTEGLAPAPPTVDLQRRMALAVCQEGRFMCYTGVTGEGTVSGYLTAEEAVARPDVTYFGTTHPWIWPLDVDDPDCEAYRTLIATLFKLDVAHVIVTSGRGRHVFAHVVDPVERDRIWAGLLEVHPDLDKVHQIDPRPSGTIRPPLAPPKLSSGHGPTMPEIDLMEALETFESWRPVIATTSHAHGPVSYQLPDWTWAYLQQDWPAANKLGKTPQMSPETGEPDRSWVDFEIALAFRNAGLGLNDYQCSRMPDGTHPSPKALSKGQRARKYLEGQWDAVMRLPSRAQVSSADIEHLDSFLADVEASPLKANHKRVIGVIVQWCLVYGKVTVHGDQRTLASEAGVGRDLVRHMFDDDAVIRYVVRWRPDAEGGRHQADVYQLQITDEHREGNQVHTIWDTWFLSGCGPGIPPLPVRTHPVYVALGVRAFDLIKVVAEGTGDHVTAFRLLNVTGSSIDRKTVTKTWRHLVAMGVIVENEDDRYSLNPVLDWNRFAMDCKAFEHADQRAEAVLRARAERDVDMSFRESPKRRAERTGAPQTIEEMSAWSAERKAMIDAEFDRTRRQMVPSAIRWRAVDPSTGELLSFPALHSMIAAPSHALVPIRFPLVPHARLTLVEDVVSVRISTTGTNDEATDAHRSCMAPRRGLCVACGRMAHADHATGLRLHGYCRAPQWIARIYEHRGQPIPARQILSKVGHPPDFDPYEIDTIDNRKDQTLWLVA